jgi:hypothetical protein
MKMHQAEIRLHLGQQEEHIMAARAADAAVVKEADKLVFKTRVKTVARGMATGGSVGFRASAPLAIVKGTSEERKKGLLAIRDRVNEMAADPVKLAEYAQDDDSMRAAPEASRERLLATSRAIAYLKSVEPPTYRPPFSGGVELANSFALAQYERTLQAVADPHRTLIHGLKNGTLTISQVDAIQAVFPKTMAKIRTDVLEKLGAAEKAGKAVEHVTRVRLGILLGMPLDSSLMPTNYMALQQAIGVRMTGNQPPPPSKNPGRPAKTGDDGRGETQSQRREGGVRRD